MRIYLCKFYDKDQGACLSWHASQREAEKKLRAHQKERAELGDDAAGPEGVAPVEVPTTRTALLAWLNASFNRDNG